MKDTAALISKQPRIRKQKRTVEIEVEKRRGHFFFPWSNSATAAPAAPKTTSSPVLKLKRNHEQARTTRLEQAKSIGSRRCRSPNPKLLGVDRQPSQKLA